MSDITLNTQSITGNHNFVPPGTDWNLGSGSKKWNGGYFGTIIADNGVPAGTAATGGDKIGQIRFSINPNIEPGYLALNGQEVNREDYPNLWAWVQQQVGFLVEEGEWQSISTAHNGNVGKYSVGNGSTTFRLPNLGCWVRGGGTAGTAAGVGGNLDAGLPNIEGGYTGTQDDYDMFVWQARQEPENRGALSSVLDSAYQFGVESGESGKFYSVRFDASDSNPIYGNAETVQPESIIGIWLVKAYHVPVTQMNEDFTINNIEIGSTNNFDLNMKFFNSLTQIGITPGQETFATIANALPDNSILTYPFNKDFSDSLNADLYPCEYGIMTVKRPPIGDGTTNTWVKFEASGYTSLESGFTVAVEYITFYEASSVITDRTPVWNKIYSEFDRTGTSGANWTPKNSQYRGRSLGTISSTTQIAEFINDLHISEGLFDGLHLGDYITVQDGTYNANWMIAGFDTEFYKGWLDNSSNPTPYITQHHITLIPRVPLFNAQMNSTNTTSGGYKGSAMHTSTLPTVVSNLQTVLGSHLLKRYALLSSAVDTTRSNMFGNAGGASSSWKWTEVYATLPSEVQIYGSTIWSSSGYDTGEACMKLPVFNFINHVQFSRWAFWLRGVASSSNFCGANSGGNADAWGASDSFGVRPVICIG